MVHRGTKMDAEQNDTDMRTEYDFSKGVRGKHYRSYRDGHTVRTYKDDGTTSVHYCTQEDDTVMPDLSS